MTARIGLGVAVLSLSMIAVALVPVASASDPLGRDVALNWTWTADSIDGFAAGVISETCTTQTEYTIEEIYHLFPGIIEGHPQFERNAGLLAASSAAELCPGGACGCGVCMNTPSGPAACAACVTCCAAGQYACCNCEGDLINQIIRAKCGCVGPGECIITPKPPPPTILKIVTS